MKQPFLIALLLLPLFAFAQEANKLNTDRPGFSQTPLTVGKGRLLLQTGQEVNRLHQQQLNGKYYNGHARLHRSSLQLRIGLSESFELQLGISPLYRRHYRGINTYANAYREIGKAPLALGLRKTLMQEAKGDPFSLGLSATYLHQHVWGRSYFRDGNWFQTGLLAAKTLSSTINALANVGTQTDERGTTELYYLMHFDFKLGKKSRTYLEARNDFSINGFSRHHSLLNAGFSWQLGDNLQLDLYAGYSRYLSAPEVTVFDQPMRLSIQERRWLMGTGLSWRLR